MIKNIIFDLDNTLYPCGGTMDKKISDRMNKAVADFLGLPLEEAILKRKENLPHHPSTMAWLHGLGMDREWFLSRVHPEGEEDEVSYDIALRPYLESLSYNKIILTNAPIEHAHRVLNKLQVQDLFSSIVDIRDCTFSGKPEESSYRIALKRLGGTIEDTVFVDDLPKYCHGYQSIGGTSILVEGETSNHIAPHIDRSLLDKGVEWGPLYKIKTIYDLKGLLESLNNK